MTRLFNLIRIERDRGNMEAIIQTGGKQHLVKKGDKVSVDRLDSELGSEMNLNVLMLVGDSKKIGQPFVEGATVKAKVCRHYRDEKIIVAKYKRRKGYHKNNGHRQEKTELEILDIQA